MQQHRRDLLITDLLLESAVAHPNRTALLSPAWHLSFGDVHARTNALAHALAARGVRRGSAVAILGRGSVQSVLAFWAVLKANATAVIATPGDGEALAELLELHRPRVLLTEARLMGSLAPLVHDPRSVEHVLICGAVGREETPPVRGAVPAVEAMQGQERRVPPVPEALAGDVAFSHPPAGGAHTHRDVIERLPPGRVAEGNHGPGLIHTASGIDRMVWTFRDACRLSFMPDRAHATREPLPELERAP